MALNAICAPMVAYESSGSITIGDSTVSIGSGDAYYITTTRASEQHISNEQLSNSNEYTVEFGERYFPDLVLDSDTDDFGRPARTWTYNTQDIGTYMDADLLVASYTEEVTGEDAYYDIGSNAINNYDISIYVDGVADTPFDADDLTRSNDDGLDATGTGVLTEIYVDHDSEEIIFVIVNTYLAEVTSDYNSSTESLVLSVYTGVDESGTEPEAETTTYRANLEDVDNLEDFVADDMVLVTLADDSVASVTTAEIVSSAEATAYTVSSGRLDTITADGTTYDTNANAFHDAVVLYDYELEELYDYAYDLYLDAYGNVIGIEETDSSSNVVFVVGYDRGSSVLASAVDQALIITTSGEMLTVDVEMDDDYSRPAETATLNKWYRYSIDEDGVYTLYDDVVRQGAQERSSNISSSYPTLTNQESEYEFDTDDGYQATVYGNSSSVYITVEAGNDVDDTGSIVDLETVVTGIRNADIEMTEVGSGDLSTIDYNVYFVYNSSGYVTYAVVIGENSGTASNFAYMVSNVTSREYISGVGYVNTYDAIVDGVLTEIQVRSSDVSSSQLSRHNLYEVDYNADGYVVDRTTLSAVDEDDVNTDDAADDEYVVVNDPTDLSVSGATLRIGSSGYLIIDDEATFYVYDADDDTYVEYSSASSAINVATPVTSGYEDGDVRAIERVSVVADSDTGYATMVAIYVSYWGDDSDDDDTTISGNVDTERAGSAAEADYTVASNGRLRLTMTYEAPAYVDALSDVSFDIIVYEDGNYYDTIAVGNGSSYDVDIGSAPLDDGQVTFTYSSSTGDYYDVGDLSFEIEDEAYTVVKVRYYDADNRVYLSESDFDADDTNFTVAVGGNSGIEFLLDTTATGTVDYTVTQDGTTGNLASGDNVTVDGSTAIQTGTASSNYTDDAYVVVTISGLDDLTANYSLDDSALDGMTLEDFGVTHGSSDKDAGLSISTSPTSWTSGANITLTVKSTAALTENFDYQVTLTINGQDYTVDLNNTGERITLTDLQGDAVVTDAQVTYEPAIELVSGTWNENQIVLNFSCELDETSAETIGNYNMASSGVSILRADKTASNQVTLYVDSAATLPAAGMNMAVRNALSGTNSSNTISATYGGGTGVGFRLVDGGTISINGGY